MTPEQTRFNRKTRKIATEFVQEIFGSAHRLQIMYKKPGEAETTNGAGWGAVLDRLLKKLRKELHP